MPDKLDPTGIAVLTPFTRRYPHYFDPADVIRLNSRLGDVTIVFNDGQPVEDWQNAPGLDWLAAKAQPRWNEYANRMTLYARALAHGCDWALWLDDDVTAPSLSKARLIDIIRQANERSAVVVSFLLREMWTPTQYRCDPPLWRDRRRHWLTRNPLFLRNPRFTPDHLRPMHALPRLDGPVLEVEEELLHWGMATPQLRANRVSKWLALDPDAKFNPVGYHYMLDETNLQLAEPKTLGDLPKPICAD
jgi:hypothetical protein